MRYPTRNGLLIPPVELGFTEVEAQRKVTTNHHWYFPRNAYTPVAHRRIFRSLTDHISPLLIKEHDSLHHDYSPPIMPKDTLMIDMVEEYLATHGVIECVREHKTNEVYEIPLESWEIVKGLYRRVA